MFLPMVPDISESNAVNWGEDTMNALQAAGGRLAFGTMEEAVEKAKTMEEEAA